MGSAWLLSALMHAALAVVLYVGLPDFSRLPPAMDQTIAVELVAEVPDTEPEPPAPAPAATAPRPEREAASPRPAPRPPQPQPEPEPEVAEAEPEPQPEPSLPPPEPAQVARPEPEPEPAPEPDVAEVEPEPAPEPEEPSPAEMAALPPEPEPEPQPEPERQREPAPTPPARPEPKPAQAPRPEPTARPAPPTPPAPEPEPEPARQPEPEPEPEEDAFASLLRSVEQLDRTIQAEQEAPGSGRTARVDPQGQGQNSLGDGRLLQSELSALRRQIGGCWRLPMGLEQVNEMVVQLRIQVRPDRTVQQVTIQDQARLERDPIFRAVAESARRAVDNCSPLALPPGKYSIWRDMVLNFRPEDAIRG